MTVKLVDHNRDNEREFSSRAEAEDKRNDLISMGANPEELEIVANGNLEVEHVDHTEDGQQATETEEQQDDESHSEEKLTLETPETPEKTPSIDQDPVEWMPSHFVDTIQGVPTVNRKGYCVIAKQYGVSVTSEPVVRASETDFEYAEFEATAITDNGETYTGFGSAHINRQDGDDPYLLNELAETRAMKRAVAWATGMGITAIEEMTNDL